MRTFHFFIAVLAGWLVVLTGLTGTILAFRNEIDRGLNPSLWRVEAGTGSASLEQIRKAVEEAGGPPPRMLLLPARDDLALLVLLIGQSPDNRWEVFVDPHNAKVLGRRRFGSSFTEKVKQIHVELFAGKQGRIVVGVGGLISMILGATGVVLWWRSRRYVAGTWSSIQIHRRLGMIGLVPSTILALSGAMLVFRPYVAPILNRATGPMPLEKVAKSSGDRKLPGPTLDEVRERALNAYPDARVTRIYLPEGPDGTFAVRLCLPEDQNPHGNTAMRFDRYSGEVVQQHTSRSTSLTQKFLWYTAYPWHTGDALGAVGKFVIAATGLVPIVLFLSGVILWRRRTKRPS